MYVESARLSDALKQLQREQHSLSLYGERIVKRIAEVNPEVQALLPEENLRRRMRANVRRVRERFPDRNHLPPLYGAMVGVKDVFHVDGYVTRAGSSVPPEQFAGPEAESVRLLREAGAVIVGKTVTTEFAYFEPGPTRNPHNLEHTPGGSSSGSAAAVAAGMCTLALGTQTIGSVIRPAAYCGVVGFKPSFDRIPTGGIIYFSRTVDHVGLFTQDVAGMAVAASVLCRDWRADVRPSKLPVLGVPDGPYLEQTEPDALEAFEEQVLMLQVAGYSVKRVPALEDIDRLNQLHRRMIFAEFAQEHAQSYANYGNLYRLRTAEAIEIGQSVDDTELAAARENCGKLRHRLMEQMEDAGIDLWVAPPATGPAPLGIHATGDPNMNLPWTHAGLPAITIPAGTSQDGLPLGLQFVARFGQDEELLAWSETLEARIGDPLGESSAIS